MSDGRSPIIIAIDGPAASGKSSTARAVAAALGYRHLDTGALYRAITLAALEAGIPPAQWDELTVEELGALGVSWEMEGGDLCLRVGERDASEAIRSAAVNEQVSRMAAVPAVRQWLLGAQRAAAAGGGLVADGRDIGTVVFPEAELKVFLVCEPEERARRRLRERGITDPDEATLAAETERLVERDRLDSTRAVAPLRRAADAVQIDTTTLDFDQQVRTIVRLARDRINFSSS